MAKYKPVYMFSDDSEALAKKLEAEGGMLKYLLGGKGANLGIMTAAGLPVPQGFTVTTGRVRNLQFQRVRLVAGP